MSDTKDPNRKTTYTPEIDPKTGEKKRKRRYTAGVESIQIFERAMALSLETVSEGMAKTLNVYNERSQKSSKDKRDGALRAGLQNWSTAVGKGMSVAGDAPSTFIRAVTKGENGKGLRKLARILLPPPLR